MKTNLASFARELQALGVSKLHIEFSDKQQRVNNYVRPVTKPVNGDAADIVNKVCKKCGQPKPETEFYMTKRGWRDSSCKACFKLRMDALRQKKKVQKSLSDFKFSPDL